MIHPRYSIYPPGYSMWSTQIYNLIHPGIRYDHIEYPDGSYWTLPPYNWINMIFFHFFIIIFWVIIKKNKEYYKIKFLKGILYYDNKIQLK